MLMFERDFQLPLVRLRFDGREDGSGAASSCFLPLAASLLGISSDSCPAICMGSEI